MSEPYYDYTAMAREAIKRNGLESRDSAFLIGVMRNTAQVYGGDPDRIHLSMDDIDNGHFTLDMGGKVKPETFIANVKRAIDEALRDPNHKWSLNKAEKQALKAFGDRGMEARDDKVLVRSDLLEQISGGAVHGLYEASVDTLVTSPAPQGSAIPRHGNHRRMAIGHPATEGGPDKGGAGLGSSPRNLVLARVRISEEVTGPTSIPLGLSP